MTIGFCLGQWKLTCRNFKSHDLSTLIKTHYSNRKSGRWSVWQGWVQLRNQTNEQTSNAIKRHFGWGEPLKASQNGLLRSLTHQKTLKNILLIPNVSSQSADSARIDQLIHQRPNTHSHKQTQTNTLSVWSDRWCVLAKRPDSSHYCLARSHHALLLMSKGRSLSVLIVSVSAQWFFQISLLALWCIGNTLGQFQGRICWQSKKTNSEASKWGMIYWHIEHGCTCSVQKVTKTIGTSLRNSLSC